MYHLQSPQKLNPVEHQPAFFDHYYHRDLRVNLNLVSYDYHL